MKTQAADLSPVFRGIIILAGLTIIIAGMMHAKTILIPLMMAIFITVTVYNLVGEGLRDALDPRLKQ